MLLFFILYQNVDNVMTAYGWPMGEVRGKAKFLQIPGTMEALYGTGQHAAWSLLCYRCSLHISWRASSFPPWSLDTPHPHSLPAKVSLLGKEIHLRLPEGRGHVYPGVYAGPLLLGSPCPTTGPERLLGFIHIHLHLELHLFSRLRGDVHHHGNARGEITQLLASRVSLWSLEKWRAGSWCHREERCP